MKPDMPSIDESAVHPNLEREVLQRLDEMLDPGLTPAERENYVPSLPLFLTVIDNLVDAMRGIYTEYKPNKLYDNDIKSLRSSVLYYRELQSKNVKKKIELGEGSLSSSSKDRGETIYERPDQSDGLREIETGQKIDNPSTATASRDIQAAEAMHHARYEFLEDNVNSLPKVKTLRAEIVSIGWLGNDENWGESEAWEFFDSPICQYLTFGQLKELRCTSPVPLRQLQWNIYSDAETNAPNKIDTFIGYQESFWGRGTPILNQTEGSLAFYESARPRHSWGEIRRTFVPFTPMGADMSGALENEYISEADVFLKPQSNSRPRGIIGYLNTPVGEVLRLAANIAHDYWLPVADVMEFILTGRFPRRNLIQEQGTTCPIYDDAGNMEYVAHGNVMLSIPLWVSPEYIASRFRTLQEVAYNWHDPENPANVAAACKSEARRMNQVLPIPNVKPSTRTRYYAPDRQTVELFRFFLLKKKEGKKSLSNIRSAFKRWVEDSDPEWSNKLPHDSAGVLRAYTRIKKQLFPHHHFATPHHLWSNIVSRIVEKAINSERRKDMKSLKKTPAGQDG